MPGVMHLNMFCRFAADCNLSSVPPGEQLMVYCELNSNQCVICSHNNNTKWACRLMRVQKMVNRRTFFKIEIFPTGIFIRKFKVFLT